MTKQLLTEVIQEAGELSGVAAKRVAEAVLEALQNEIMANGRLTLSSFGTFILKETPAKNALNPRTGAAVKVKPGATVRFKASPTLRAAALAAVKKSKRLSKKAADGGTKLRSAKPPAT